MASSSPSRLRDLLQHVRPEACRLGVRGELLKGDPHATSSQARSTTSRGATRFQRETRRPRPFLAPSMRSRRRAHPQRWARIETRPDARVALNVHGTVAPTLSGGRGLKHPIDSAPRRSPLRRGDGSGQVYCRDSARRQTASAGSSRACTRTISSGTPKCSATSHEWVKYSASASSVSTRSAWAKSSASRSWRTVRSA